MIVVTLTKLTHQPIYKLGCTTIKIKAKPTTQTNTTSSADHLQQLINFNNMN